MSVSTTSSQVIVAGNGATTVFSFPFIGVASSDISVIYTDVAGVQTVLSPSNYTVALTAAAVGQLWGIGGTVTYPLSGSPIASGTTLTIARILPLTQATTLSNQNTLYLQSIESAIDTICMEVQQVNSKTGMIRGTWATTTAYNYSDIVIDGANGANTNSLYLCVTPNTSGTWATDLAAGYWTLALNVPSISGGYLPLVGGAISGSLSVAGTLTAATGAVTGALSVAGNLTAVTQANLDSSTKAATTAFVNSANGASHVLISTQTPSASAQIDFTELSTAYDQYIIRLTGVAPTTDAQSLLIQVSSNNGASFIAANYIWAAATAVSTGSGANSANTSDSGFNVTGVNVSNDASQGINGTIHIVNMASSAKRKRFIAVTDFYDGTNYRVSNCGGNYSAATTVMNALRLKFVSGTIASGKISLYGVRS